MHSERSGGGSGDFEPICIDCVSPVFGDLHGRGPRTIAAQRTPTDYVTPGWLALLRRSVRAHAHLRGMTSWYGAEAIHGSVLWKNSLYCTVPWRMDGLTRCFSERLSSNGLKPSPYEGSTTFISAYSDATIKPNNTRYPVAVYTKRPHELCSRTWIHSGAARRAHNGPMSREGSVALKLH
ncbi:unnamed protein product, partial [Iphiclides podalirius]